MRHLFTDLQCERPKGRWREPGVDPVTPKLLFQWVLGVDVATAHRSSSLTDRKALSDSKVRGPDSALAA